MLMSRCHFTQYLDCKKGSKLSGKLNPRQWGSLRQWGLFLIIFHFSLRDFVSQVGSLACWGSWLYLAKDHEMQPRTHHCASEAPGSCTFSSPSFIIIFWARYRSPPEPDSSDLALSCSIPGGADAPACATGVQAAITHKTVYFQVLLVWMRDAFT